MFWTIFTFPGRAIAWFAYMFPKQGDVWASARRVDSPGVHLIFSLMVYAGLGYLGVAALTGDRGARASTPQRAVGEVAGSTVEAAPYADEYPPAQPLYETAPPEPEGVNDYGPPADAETPVFTSPSDAVVEPLAPAPVKPESVKASPPPAPVDVQAISPSSTPALRGELMRLLDSGPTERHGTWAMPGVQGELMVTPWRRSRTGVCRLYSFTARSANDMAASGYREVCRTGDGPWALD